MKELVKKEIEAIQNIPIDGKYDEVINIIYKQVHKLKGKLITSGMGKAGQIALNIATTFSSTGTCSVYLHPADAQHGDLGILKDNDIFLLLSNSGKTKEIIELITLANNMCSGIKFISITGNPNSKLARSSDVTLLTGGSPEICPLGLTPTISTTLMTVIGDLLVVSTMKKINFTKEDYALRHHSGYLGAKASDREE